MKNNLVTSFVCDHGLLGSLKISTSIEADLSFKKSGYLLKIDFVVNQWDMSLKAIMIKQIMLTEVMMRMMR